MQKIATFLLDHKILWFTAWADESKTDDFARPKPNPEKTFPGGVIGTSDRLHVEIPYPFFKDQWRFKGCFQCHGALLGSESSLSLSSTLFP
jgi:hypothetical protein